MTLRNPETNLLSNWIQKKKKFRPLKVKQKTPFTFGIIPLAINVYIFVEWSWLYNHVVCTTELCAVELVNV